MNPTERPSCVQNNPSIVSLTEPRIVMASKEDSIG
jgi:hypothetical protein